jgi:hypothetical protein
VGIATLFLALAVPGSLQAGPDLRTERMIGPGARCITIARAAGPWVIRVLETDGESAYVRPGVTFASERGLRAAPVSAQARRATTEARYPIAGVNGDFFVQSPGPFEAQPIGALVVGGEVIGTPYPRSAFLIGTDARYAIQRFRLAAWVERTDGARLDLKGVNQPCGANDLVLYTPRFGPSTHTKAPAAEVTLGGLELPVRLGTTYHAKVTGIGEQGDSAIPADGVVLTARGAAQEFLRSLKPDDQLQIRLDFDPPVPPDTDVIGGGPTLVRDGRVVVKEDTEGFKPDVVAGRAPRTAVGYNGRRLLLVTVDGRQPAISVGMTLVELAELMRELGCTDAMNLDGGGSTTTWVRGAVVNQPSAGQERRVAEALFLFSSAPKGPPARLIVAPEEISILAGATCPITLAGAEDVNFNPVPAPPGEPRWSIPPGLGVIAQAGGEGVAGVRTKVRMASAPEPRAEPRVYREQTPLKRAGERAGTLVADSSGLPGRSPAVGQQPAEKPDHAEFFRTPANGVTPAIVPMAAASDTQPSGATVLTLRPDATDSTRTAELRVQAGGLIGAARLRIYARPPHVQITPARLVLSSGGIQALSVQALDEWGRPIVAAGLPIRWSCPPELGQVDESGLFHAAATAARGEVSAEIAGARAAIPVVIGTETRLLDGFETAGRWSASTIPATVKGALSPADDEPHEGRRALKLEYDFTTDHATRAVYANARLPIGQPVALRLWVRGDGGGAWLRARLRDARGQAQVVDFTRRLGKLDDWQELTASIPSTLPGPLTLEALYLAEPDPNAQPRGAIELDALAGDYAPAAGTGRVPVDRALPAPVAPAVR